MLVFSCSLSYIYYLPLDINELGDIFHLWFLFLPFVLYQDLLVILILFSSFLDMLIMLTLVLIKYALNITSYVWIHLFRKFPNISANNNVSLWMCKSWKWPRTFDAKSLQNCFACLKSAFACLLCLRFCKNSLLYGNDVFQFLRINFFH